MNINSGKSFYFLPELDLLMSKIECDEIAIADTGSNCFLKQSNALTTAAYTLTRNEKRLIYIVVEILTTNNIPEVRGRYDIEIHHGYYHRLFGGGNNVARDINEASRLLNTREVIFYLPEENGDGDTEDDIALDGLSWTVKRGTRPKLGLTLLSINAEVADFMLATHQFTGYYLRDVASLDRVISMRLYESIMQWHNRMKRNEQSVTFSYEWIMDRYQLPASLRVITDFRKRFLRVATKEITDKTDIDVRFEEHTHREGRKIVLESVTFFWSKKRRNKSKKSSCDNDNIETKTVSLKMPHFELMQTEGFILASKDYLNAMISNGANLELPQPSWFSHFIHAHKFVTGLLPDLKYMNIAKKVLSEQEYNFLSSKGHM